MWLEIGKALVEIFTKQKQVKQEERQRLSTLFQHMSELLEDTARDLEKDLYPHGKCATMEMLSNELSGILIGKIESEKLDEVHRILLESSRLESEYAKRKDPETIKNLLIASGKFKALSIILAA